MKFSIVALLVAGVAAKWGGCDFANLKATYYLDKECKTLDMETNKGYTGFPKDLKEMYQDGVCKDMSMPKYKAYMSMRGKCTKTEIIFEYYNDSGDCTGTNKDVTKTVLGKCMDAGFGGKYQIMHNGK